MFHCRWVRWPQTTWFYDRYLFKSWHRDIRKCRRIRWHRGEHVSYE